MKVERTGRMITLSDLPAQVDGLINDLPEISVTVNYVVVPNDGNNLSKAILVDHLIIPQIVDALGGETDKADTTPQQKADELHAKVQNAALVDLDAIAASLSKNELQDVTNWLEGQMQYHARIWAYLSARHGSGCGDQGHDEAVKQQNKAVCHVRRMIGFTQIKNDVTF
jgi:hypothetical protein